MLDYSIKLIDGERLLYLVALILSTVLFCYFFFLHYVNKHIKENANISCLLLKHQELIENNYKSLQLFLKSITELNGLFEAHLAVVNDSTEKASLAIIEKLLSVDVEVNRLSSVLQIEKLNLKEIHDENRQRMEACLKSINSFNEQLTFFFSQREQDSVLENSAIIKAKELPSLTGIMRDCLAYTDFILPTQVAEVALNGNPEPFYLITAKDVHSLKKCIDIATFRIEEISTQITDDLAKSIISKGYFKNKEVVNWLDAGPIVIQNISRELTSAIESSNISTFSSYDSIDIMRASILEALTHTQFQDVSRQQIEVVAKGLGLCGHYSVQLSQALCDIDLEPVSAPNLKEEVIQILQSSYTMESQRVTHAKSIGDGIALEKSGHPEFELF
jgi:hypothetical protein